MIHARGLVQVFHTGKGKKKREVRAVDGVDLDIAEGGRWSASSGGPTARERRPR